MVRVLGIDPGTRVAGFGIVEVGEHTEIKGVTAGVWVLSSSQPLAARLAELSTHLREVIELYKPEHLVVELAFVAENIRSALFLGHARGVILATGHLMGLEITEISATAAKKAITHYGRAEKDAVAEMLERLLKMPLKHFPRDASDALALAYAQAVVEKRKLLTGMEGEQNVVTLNVLEQWAKTRRTKKKNPWERIT